MAQERTQGAARGPAAPITPSEVAAQRASRGRRNPRPWETEQALANRHARTQERAQQAQKSGNVGHRAGRFVGSVIESKKNKTVLRDAKGGISKLRTSIGESMSMRGEDNKTHKIKGPLTMAARGVRVAAPKIAKYSAIGLGASAVGAFGAVPLAAVGAGVLGVRKLHHLRRDAPAKAQENVTKYREHLAQQEADRKEAAKEANIQANAAEESKQKEASAAKVRASQESFAEDFERRYQTRRAAQAQAIADERERRVDAVRAGRIDGPLDPDAFHRIFGE